MKTRAVGGVVAVTLMIGLPSVARAQHFPSDAELTELAQSRIDEGRGVGIVFGMLDADGSTRIVSVGSAGPAARPLGDMTVFEIGSITKVFTATLLADMAAQGVVAFGDPVAGYLPDNVTVPSRGREITLLDLSTQHSGLPRMPNNFSPADATNPYVDYSVDQMYAFLSGYELPRDVGAQFEYSNLGVGLLGHVLSLAAGQSYEELVRERVLGPLGMDMTAMALQGDMLQWIAQGHNTQGDVVSLWDIPTLAGAGALRSNMVDMLRFLRANVGEPTSDLERSMRLAQEVREEAGPGMSIGMNWLTLSRDGRRIVWHNGGTGGFRTFLGFDPEAEVGVVVLTNTAHAVDDLGVHLLDPSYPLAPPPAPVVEREEIELPAEVVERYVGVYELAPTFSIAVTVEGATLFIEPTAQPRIEAFAESETDFFLRVVDAQITFEVDADGNATGLVLHQNGQNVPGRKVE